MSSRKINCRGRYLRAAAVLLACAVSAALACAQDPGGVSSRSQDGYPRPSIAPVAWQIDFDWRTPRRIVVQLPGQSAPKAYWYMIYTVTNNNDSELFFIPAIEMLMQDGRVIPANRNIPLAVFDAIQKRARGIDLVMPQDMVGDLLRGEDALRSSVAIWEEPSPEMGTFDIFVGGLSGEVAILKDSSGEPLKDAEGDLIRVRKTRQLRFKVRGDDRDKFDDVVNLVLDTWVMR